MKIAFYGSSLLSSYWNGAATYYRGIIRALHARGYDVTFYEPDAYGRQQHRDIEPPDYAKVVVYPATDEAVRAVIAEAAELVRPRAEQQGVTLHVNDPGTCVTGEVDRAQLHSALINLLFNALDAMPQGGQLAVELSPAPGGAAWPGGGSNA